MDKNILKILTVLFEHGYNDEKAIASVGVKELVDMKCCSEANMRALLTLQEAIKSNKVISCLRGQMNTSAMNDRASV